MEGQNGLATVADGKVKLRFRAKITGGHVAFFNFALSPEPPGLNLNSPRDGVRRKKASGAPIIPRSESGKNT